MDPEQLAAKLRSLTSAFTTGQLFTLAITFFLVIGVVIGSAVWLQKPTFRLLQSDLDPEAMGQVVARLKTLKVAYELDEGGRGIRVPASRIDELRLEFATNGIEAGAPGWNLFDQTRLGLTEVGERVNIRRALEGEMARTIAGFSEVASARVHIAMGKEQLFGDSRPPTASVVIKLRSGRSLPSSAVNGITTLVAGGVDGLKPESVVVLDNFGRPLTRPKADENDPGGAASFERQQRLERDYASRVVAMLEPIVGVDRVRVNVALALKRETTEQTQETWDPTMTVARSQQTTSETTSSGMVPGPVTPPPGLVPGTAGARANLPPPANLSAAVQAVQGPSSQRTSETKNNEIGKTTIHTIQPSGEIARLSVAVIVDDSQLVKTENGTTTATRAKRTSEELKKFENLVGSSVGFNAERGDQITVENIAFDEPMGEEVQAPSALVRYQPQIEETIRVGGVILVVVLAFMFVVRPLMKKVQGGPTGVAVARGTGAPASRPRTVAELEGDIEAQLDAAESKVDRRLPVLTKRVAEATQKEPEHVAKVLRSWMTEEAR
jgi:flagellar M-ring protein FliF